jgi:hypothetical protein
MLAAAAGAALMTAAMTASPAKADTIGTTTSLILQSNQVVLGAEFAFEMTVDTNATSGTWSIEAGSPATGTIGLCGGDLSTSTGCFMPQGALPPGNYNLLAIYSGNENFGPSASGLESLTVLATEPSAVSLRQSSSMVTVGHEQSDLISFNATDALTGRPAEGQVTVTANGNALTQCTGVFVLQDLGGAASCTLTASELQPGTYQLIASFSGSQDFGNATSAPPLTLTVVPPQPTTTSLTLSPASVPFGNEQTETLTATVSPATSGTPTGAVTVMSGTTPVCTVTLAGGTGTCSPQTGSQLAIGSYPLTASYSGDNTYAVSTDTSQTLIVAKEPTNTSLTLTADTVARGSEQAEKFTATVAPATSGTPTGTVEVKAGSVGLCPITLVNGTGSCFLTPSQLRRGSYLITATYNGDATYAVSTSTPPQPLTVVAK